MNIVSKNGIVQDLNAIKIEKNLKTSYASSKLAAIYSYSFANPPLNFDYSKIKVNIRN